MSFNPKITTLGLNKHAEAFAADQAFTITHISFGSGFHNPNGSETAMDNQLVKLPVGAGAVLSNSQVRLSAIWSDNNASGNIKEIGIWAETDHNPLSQVLLAYYSTGAGTLIAQKTNEVDYIAIYDFVIEAIDNLSITVVADAGQSALLAALGVHTGDQNAHPQYAKREMQIYCNDTTGGAAALVAQPFSVADRGIASYVEGQSFIFKASVNAAANATLRIANTGNTLTAKLIKVASNNIPSGAIVSGQTYEVLYNGTDFILMGNADASLHNADVNAHPLLARKKSRVFCNAVTNIAPPIGIDTAYSVQAFDSANSDLAGGLDAGATLIFKPNITNTGITTITLNNDTLADVVYPVKYKGADLSAGALQSNKYYEFIFGGTNLILLGESIDEHNDQGDSHKVIRKKMPIYCGVSTGTASAYVLTSSSGSIDQEHTASFAGMRFLFRAHATNTAGTVSFTYDNGTTDITYNLAYKGSATLIAGLLVLNKWYEVIVRGTNFELIGESISEHNDSPTAHDINLYQKRSALIYCATADVTSTSTAIKIASTNTVDDVNITVPAGARFLFKSNVTSAAGTVTLTYENGATDITENIRYKNSITLSAGIILPNKWYEVVYTGSVFELIGESIDEHNEDANAHAYLMRKSQYIYCGDGVPYAASVGYAHAFTLTGNNPANQVISLITSGNAFVFRSPITNTAGKIEITYENGVTDAVAEVKYLGSVNIPQGVLRNAVWYELVLHSGFFHIIGESIAEHNNDTNAHDFLARRDRRIYCGNATGTANAITLTPPNALDQDYTLSAGMCFLFESAFNNTDAVTITYNGQTKAVKYLGQPLFQGVINAVTLCEVVYNGTDFDLIGRHDERIPVSFEQYSVGAAGDYTNLNDALADIIKTYRNTYQTSAQLNGDNGGHRRVSINILSGYQINKPVIFNGYDASWITITSDADITVLDSCFSFHSNVTYSDEGRDFAVNSVFAAINGGSTPVIEFVMVCGDATSAAASPVEATINSNGWIGVLAHGKGSKAIIRISGNTTNPIDNRAGVIDKNKLKYGFLAIDGGVIETWGDTFQSNTLPVICQSQASSTTNYFCALAAINSAKIQNMTGIVDCSGSGYMIHCDKASEIILTKDDVLLNDLSGSKRRAVYCVDSNLIATDVNFSGFNTSLINESLGYIKNSKVDFTGSNFRDAVNFLTGFGTNRILLSAYNSKIDFSDADFRLYTGVNNTTVDYRPLTAIYAEKCDIDIGGMQANLIRHGILSYFSKIQGDAPLIQDCIAPIKALKSDIKITGGFFDRTNNSASGGSVNFPNNSLAQEFEQAPIVAIFSNVVLENCNMSYTGSAALPLSTQAIYSVGNRYRYGVYAIDSTYKAIGCNATGAGLYDAFMVNPTFAPTLAAIFNAKIASGVYAINSNVDLNGCSLATFEHTLFSTAVIPVTRTVYIKNSHLSLQGCTGRVLFGVTTDLAGNITSGLQSAPIINFDNSGTQQPTRFIFADNALTERHYSADCSESRIYDGSSPSITSVKLSDYSFVNTGAVKRYVDGWLGSFRVLV